MMQVMRYAHTKGGKMRYLFIFISFFVLFLLPFASLAPADATKAGEEATEESHPSYPAKILEVHDGDSIKVMMDGQETWVRLYGIDAPESGQPHGQAAMRALMELTSGKHIMVQPVLTDRYQCRVVMAFADEESLQEAMLRLGYAWVNPRYCHKSLCAEWKKLEEEARTENKGLWQDKNPTPPWVWRKK